MFWLARRRLRQLMRKAGEGYNIRKSARFVEVGKFAYFFITWNLALVGLGTLLFKRTDEEGKTYFINPFDPASEAYRLVEEQKKIPWLTRGSIAGLNSQQLKALYDEETNEEGFDSCPQENEERFTLLDGPPYANGDAHVGHALNKILKDFVVRSKMQSGHRVTFRPGWDCHGLPIEMKVAQGMTDKLNEGSTSSSPSTDDVLARRAACRQTAHNAVDGQRNSFKSWSILADWSNPYITMSNEYCANQTRLVGKMLANDRLYQARRPVHWSPVAQTALAEAELTYKDDHVSTAVYARMPIANWSGDEPAYAMVWTTTPWTLPCNDALCYSNDIDYVLVNLARVKGVSSRLPLPVYIMSKAGAERYTAVSGQQTTVIGTIAHARLSSLIYAHPHWRTVTRRIFEAQHVTDSIGTGIVHAAYAHGKDDALVAQENGEEVVCHVDARGNYDRAMGPFLGGMNVLEEKTIQTVLTHMKHFIMHTSPHTHSYPYDWRTRTPVITRASRQWFMRVDDMRASALRALDDVRMFGVNANSTSLSTMIKNRPDWCISRQRCWGVPLPVFYDTSDNDAVVHSREISEHIASLFAEHGTDIWWSADINTLLPNHLRPPSIKSGEQLRRNTDVMDVWLDSGSAWASQADPDRQADLVIEGDDQRRGWFQSLLFTKLAVDANDNVTAPYKQLLTHPFVVDEEGRKMSKSLGNVVSPDEIVHGTPKQKGIGVDGLRLWAAVSGTGSGSHALLSREIVDTCAQRINRMRSVLKFVLGVTHELPTNPHIDMAKCDVFDKYLLASVAETYTSVQQSYDSFNFARAVSDTTALLNGRIGRWYVGMVKDSLYCDRGDDARRMNRLAVLKTATDTCVHLLSPIVPVLCDEYHAAHSNGDYAVRSHTPLPLREWSDKTVVDAMTAVLNGVVDECTKVVDSKTIGQAVVHIEIGDEQLMTALRSLADENVSVNELLQMLTKAPKVTVVHTPNAAQAVSVHSTPLGAAFAKCDRCRLHAEGVNKQSLCPRCDTVMLDIDPLQVARNAQ